MFIFLFLLALGALAMIGFTFGMTDNAWNNLPALVNATAWAFVAVVFALAAILLP